MNDHMAYNVVRISYYLVKKILPSISITHVHIPHTYGKIKHYQLHYVSVLMILESNITPIKIMRIFLSVYGSITGYNVITVETKCCDLTDEWNNPGKYLDISMPKYINKALH